MKHESSSSDLSGYGYSTEWRPERSATERVLLSRAGLTVLSGALLVQFGFGLPVIRQIAPELGGALSALVYPAIAVGLLLVIAARIGVDRVRVNLPLAMFITLACSSMLWTTSSTATAGRLFGLAVALLFAICISQLPQRELVYVAITVAIVGCTASILLVFALPEVGISNDTRGAFWQGGFATKNVFGRFCGLALVAMTLVTASSALTRRIRMASLFGGIIALLGLTNSGSAGSLVATVVATALVVVLLPLAGRDSPMARILAASALISMVAVTTAIVVFQDRGLGRYLNREDTLTGRSTIWRGAEYYAQDRPLLGYGYGSFYSPGSATANAMARTLGVPVPHSHSFMLDMRIDLGWIGILAWIAILVSLLSIGTRMLAKQRDLWPLVLLAFVLVSDLAESTSLNGAFPALLFSLIVWHVEPDRNGEA